jgi:hypothetical protein
MEIELNGVVTYYELPYITLSSNYPNDKASIRATPIKFDIQKHGNFVDIYLGNSDGIEVQRHDLNIISKDGVIPEKCRPLSERTCLCLMTINNLAQWGIVNITASGQLIFKTSLVGSGFSANSENKILASSIRYHI